MGEKELLHLLTGCLKSDRVSQKLLYKAFYGYAMAICLRYANNRYEAAEILNQGFLKVFTNLNRYENNKPFKAWLARIMINTSIDHYRSNLKTARTDDIENAHHLSDDNFADKNLSYNELVAIVQQLSPAYRAVFNLYAIEGYTHEEIGDLLDISIGTSKSNLHKAREKLKKIITDENSLPHNMGEQQTIRMVPIQKGDMSLSYMNNGAKQ
ncbi:RNA polymerase subunit sigma-24 [Mucilaginibacter sp. PAMC 26640]|nr:RNA polymerase subunit sigma-24 [Mucilaginibacter sp. PAMC 26640]